MGKDNPNEVKELTGNRYKKINESVNDEDTVKSISKAVKDHTTLDYSFLAKLPKNFSGEVHHARATEEEKKGENILELFVAGSGNNQFAKMYKNMTGYNEQVGLEEEKKDEDDPSMSFLEEMGIAAKKQYKLTKQDAPSLEELSGRITEIYGKPMYMDKKGKILEAPNDDTRVMTGIRKKVSGQKTQYNFSGPLGGIFGTNQGMRNAGDYSIENLREYLVQSADEWLSDLARRDNGKPINIYMRGHSRGGVAANEGATMINYLIQTKYPQFKDRVKINTLIYDPVPGTGSYNKHASLNHTEKNIKLNNNRVGKGLMSEKESKNDPVVLYSLHSDHTTFFDPQAVMGARKVILTGRNHSMGLYDIAGGKNGEKLHKSGYISAENGAEYRGSGIHDLKDGLYISDERNALLKLTNRQESINLLKSLYKGKITQGTRHDTMYNVVHQYFDSHPEEITKKDTRYAPLMAAREDIANIKGFVAAMKNPNEDMRPADPKGAMSRLMASYITHIKQLDECNAMKFDDRITDKNFKKYQEAANNFNEVLKTEKSAQFKKFLKDMTLEDLERIAEKDAKANVKSELARFNANSVLNDKQKAIDTMFKKNIAEDASHLFDVVAQEKNISDADIADLAGAKKRTVAMLLGHQNLANKFLREMNRDKNKLSAWEDKNAQMERDISKLENSKEFNDFYKNLTDLDFKAMATGDSKILQQYLKDLAPKKEKAVNPVSERVPARQQEAPQSQNQL